MAIRNSRLAYCSRRQAIALLGSGLGVGGALRTPAALAATSQAVFKSVAKINVPKNAIIRTVLKDVSPDTLTSGATLIHEHLGNNVDLMAEELRAAAIDGFGC